MEQKKLDVASINYQRSIKTTAKMENSKSDEPKWLDVKTVDYENSATKLQTIVSSIHLETTAKVAAVDSKIDWAV